MTSWSGRFNSLVFINIVERHFSDIFYVFIFNDLQRLSPHFYFPFFFMTRRATETANCLLFNEIDFCVISAIHC